MTKRKKVRIALIHEIITPYRIPLFNFISSIPYIDLCVFFSTITKENRKWNIPSNLNFKYQILRGKELKLNLIDFFSSSLTLSLFRIIKNNKFDLVIICGYSNLASQIGYLMAKLKKIPVIIWIGSTNKGESFFRKLFLPVIKLMITKSSIIIVYGTEAKKFVERLEAKERRIFIAYNTVPINHILATPKPKQKIYFKETKNILFVGRLIKIKGIDTLISAFKLLKSKINNSRLLIVGEGKQLHFLKKKCENLQIEKDVEFLGFLEGKDLTKIYQTADLFVLPSRWEIWGLVLNEAMAHGLPVIATNSCGASTDLIYPGLNGYVIPPNDPVILMKACNKILSNNNRAKKMGEYSKDIIKEFTIEKEAQAFIEAIKFILVNTKRQRDLKIDDNVKNYHIEK